MGQGRSSGMHKRSEIDIIEAILEYVYREGHAKKTHIMYAANLNTKTLEKLLSRLMFVGALKRVEVRHSRSSHIEYILTPKGRLILMFIKRIKSLFNISDTDDTELSILIEDILEDVRSHMNGAVIKRFYEPRSESGISYTIDAVIEYEGRSVAIEVLDKATKPEDLSVVLGDIVLKFIDAELNKGIILAPSSIAHHVDSVLRKLRRNRLEVSVVHYEGLDDRNRILRQVLEILAYR